MSHSHNADIDSIRTIPDPGERIPAIALPTLALFLGAWAIWIASSFLALSGIWPWPLTIVVNTGCAFALFTVFHDAAHRSLSSHIWINTWLGRISALSLSPALGFRAFRYIHMQHHRFTNEVDGQDPDHYTLGGPSWQRILRFMTLDLNYLFWYAPRMSKRPGAERIEAAVMLTFTVVALASLIATGNFVMFGLVCWLVPARLAVLMLGWAFDYLPHNGLGATAKSNKFQATRNRVGLERLLSPLMLYQNYHLVHHLHPLIPFYRYIAVWRRSESRYLERDPALSTVEGRPLTVDEYRELRKLAGGH